MSQCIHFKEKQKQKIHKKYLYTKNYLFSTQSNFLINEYNLVFNVKYVTRDEGEN